MPKIIRTPDNPYGLSHKQRLVISDIVTAIKSGNRFNAVTSHERIYNVKNRQTAAVIANENLNRHNFREALYKEMEYCGVYGVSGKVEGCLIMGLDATKRNETGDMVPDHLVRLRYIQEINKVCGLYS